MSVASKLPPELPRTISGTRVGAHGSSQILRYLGLHMRSALTALCNLSRKASHRHVSSVSLCWMQALTDALMSGHLGGAGLDVHWVVSAADSLA